MQPFDKLVAVAAPLDEANVNTDRIIPARFLSKPRDAGYGAFGFRDVRFDADGNEIPDFVLNQPPYRDAKIIVAGPNFGCGSSREAAVYVLYDMGIRSVIAPSFGDIHYGNQLQNGMLPIVLPEATCRSLIEQLRREPGATIAIDLEAQTVTAPDGAVHGFNIAATSKERLLKGLDDVELVMQQIAGITDFEHRYHDALPWLPGAR
jgi:3-isopropylmalate/(R)-2-methylmalate dehydratase small subunit